MLKIKYVTFLLLVLFIINNNISAQTSTETIPDPTESIETITTEEIKINVSAFKSNGSFAKEITLNDLVIIEDGRIHQATSVRHIPANILLVLDIGNEISYAKRSKITAQTAHSFINSLESDDSVAIMQYGEDVELLSDWTKDKVQLMRILKSTNLGFGYFSVFNEAIRKVIEFFGKTSLENRHLVLVTDGIDGFSDGLTKDLAAKNLLLAGINTHVISYTRLQQHAINSSNSKDKGTYNSGFSINLDRSMIRKHEMEIDRVQKSEKFLITLAKDSNGEIFLPDTSEEMIENATVLAKYINSQYVVTYTPNKPLEKSENNETRVIEVSSKLTDVRIKGYRKFILSQ